MNLFLALSFFASGIFIIRWGVMHFSEVRKIQDLAKVDIGSAPQGLVEIEGFVWPAAHSMKSIFGKDVVFYNLQVQERTASQNYKESWKTVYEFDFEKPFYVIDSSGVCVVHPRKQNMKLLEYNCSLSKKASDIEAVKTALKVIGPLSKIFIRKYRVVEKRLLAGSPVYVCGEMQPLTPTKYKVRGDFRKFLADAKSVRKSLYSTLKFDFDRNGIVTDSDMQTGFSDAADIELREGKTEVVDVAGVISHTENHSLIVADCFEEHLIKRLQKEDYLFFFLGLIFIVAGVFVLVPEK